ncbi:MAG: MqnA/MqnD/SBP family protein [Thermodesulfobacteriota bacterium]|nr:MqnA/MqnD/SBP family protein [Thermodesulfobacteriota bacterium]
MKSGRDWESISNIKLVLVSYLNTYPLVWGLKKLFKKGKGPEIILCPPSHGSRLLMEGKVDIALVPSITYLNCNTPFEVLPFGIISRKEVDTVLLVGNASIENWERIFLDEDSLSSIELTKILFQIKNRKIEFIDGIREIENLDENSGALIIGNKCFKWAQNFSWCYDLSKLWFDFTGLPFVFAIVLARPEIGKDYLLTAYDLIDKVIRVGIENIAQVVEDWLLEYPHEIKLKKRSYYYSYLKNKIFYNINREAILGLKKFYSINKKILPEEKAIKLSNEYFRMYDPAFGKESDSIKGKDENS